MIEVECDKLIKTLKGAQRKLSSAESRGGLHNYLYDMWEIGRDNAQFSYDNAVTKEGEKANQGTEVTPSPKFTKDGFELTASGPDICFLEFGTGLQMDTTNPYASKMGFFPSSYSGSVGKGFLVPPKLNHFHGAWPHEGKLHWGQNPAKGMYNAYKAMEFYARTTPLRLF